MATAIAARHFTGQQREELVRMAYEEALSRLQPVHNLKGFYHTGVCGCLVWDDGDTYLDVFVRQQGCEDLLWDPLHRMLTLLAEMNSSTRNEELLLSRLETFESEMAEYDAGQQQ